MRLVDLRNDTGSDGLASLSEGESRTGLEGDVVDEVSDHLDIVTGHDLNAWRRKVNSAAFQIFPLPDRTYKLLVGTLGSLGEGQSDGDIGSSQEQLRSVVGHEGGVSSTFLLGQDLYRMVTTVSVSHDIAAIQMTSNHSRRSEP